MPLSLTVTCDVLPTVLTMIVSLPEVPCTIVSLTPCTIGAMVIPSVSFDYKLSILVAPTALAVLEFERWAGLPAHPRRAGIAALVLMIGAYATTLFSFELKPALLDNNCVALFVMLGCVTAMAAMRSIARTTSPVVPA